MILSGANGNILNITQIACSVGQQALWSKRISFGYTKRTLSFFKESDLSPKARGFVYSSYLEGLEPYEFFFGSMTGRDALMDTALRTPKSGYLYRRLANALQDLKIAYDKTVRDASENIVEFKFGDDGLDVSELHKKGEIQPGEAIGIITAQSFGEPSTQMALSVFHFAGIQEMQITLGLPRLIEIFDARRMPSTPITEIYLERDYNNEKDARSIAERVKEIKIKDVASEIKIDFSGKKIEISLNKETLKVLRLTPEKVVERLNEGKLKGDDIVLSNPELDFKALYKLKERVKDTSISGVKGIKQILVIKRDANYIIMCHGSNLEEIFKVKGVDRNKTRTNNIYEIADVLGIEAARQTIIDEVNKVINQQGLSIDSRYIKLIADAMTVNGEIKGATRMGMISEKKSVLARASFETPVKQFVNATVKGTRDELASVIENTILNQPVPVGTGLPGLLVKVIGPLVKEKEKPVKKEKEKKE
jgi:DNA-directed RNA polymerase subunit A"